MIKLDLKPAIKEFDRYVKLQKDGVCGKNADTIKGLMDKKVIHTMNVVQDGTTVVEKLRVDDSFKKMIQIALLDHDIGRFAQVRTTGSFNDQALMLWSDHGELGGDILATGLIEKQIPNTRIFDRSIINVVRNHVSARINQRDLSAILYSGLLEYGDAYYIYGMESEQTKAMVDNFITQVIQDVDRLDIYRQVVDGRFVPKKSNAPIAPTILEAFYKGQYLDIGNLKKRNLWNANVGELVRLSFINDIKLLSVAKMIKNENLLPKMQLKRSNPYVSDAYKFTIEKLDHMIENSKDGVTLYKKR